MSGEERLAQLTCVTTDPVFKLNVSLKRATNIQPLFNFTSLLFSSQQSLLLELFNPLLFLELLSYIFHRIEQFCQHLFHFDFSDAIKKALDFRLAPFLGSFSSTFRSFL